MIGVGIGTARTDSGGTAVRDVWLVGWLVCWTVDQLFLLTQRNDLLVVLCSLIVARQKLPARRPETGGKGRKDGGRAGMAAVGAVPAGQVEDDQVEESGKRGDECGD